MITLLRLPAMLSLLLPLAAIAATESLVPPPGRTGWQPLVFPRIPRTTRYTPVAIDGLEAVRAESDCAASALLHPLTDVDLARTPHLRWQWKIERGLTVANERVKAGDDFAARVYLLFRFDAARATLAQRLRHRLGTMLYGEEVPGNALNYVWTSDEPAGARWQNPFSAEAEMIALGRGPLTDWAAAEADVAADYRAAFGHEPPPLLALAVMTDADNTCQQAVAYYADFRFVTP